MYWQVQEAKQRFSEVLRAAAAGVPQIVTRHGEEVAVVIDINHYRHLQGEPLSFMDYLRADPVHGLEKIEFERQGDLPREIDLSHEIDVAG